ncbi:cytochrome P450, putative [Talaromyces stipitatus ATCC 10500]|uniref:Cytochrome P450, putative n=1 Tax=Talaromyces stipitatus (strain ATCC 10500 / CBS 375.48 / QM 6759 / NRRL 1006) TaxID=441959 RepID=B8M886_TALSN|nr:cytochrome P450, putative [Talaromyces stipitatus ATCC 10500]EED20399.1 cytochrome P450, putative [Talaromyces stipitatus ATCC 10500]
MTVTSFPSIASRTFPQAHSIEMISELLSSVLGGSQHLLILLPTWTAALWILWYCWKFILSPHFYKDEPPIYPYYIPFIGHLRSFIQDAGSLVKKAESCFGEGKLFGVQIAGKKLYIITSAEGTKEFYRNTTALDFTAFQLDTLKQFGMSPAGCKLMSKHIQGRTNGRDRINIDLIVDVHHRNLHSSANLGQIASPVAEYISNALRLETLPEQCIRFPGPRTEGKVVSLYTLCEEVILRANITGFWGNDLLDIAPDLVSTTSTLDRRFHNLLLRIPRLLEPEVYNLRDKVLDYFDRYMDIPMKARTSLSPLIKELEQTSRDLGLSQRDIAVYHLAWLLASNNNIHAACFWVLAHLAESPDLANKVREETAGIARNALSFSPAEALKDNQLPCLMALWREVLRFYGGPHTSGRHVQEDTVFTGKRLRRGASLLVATSTLQRDKAVWGADADEFVPNRFLRSPYLAKVANYRPFGGGISHCSGQHLAFVEMAMVVACLLDRFDMQIVPGVEETAFPQPFKAAPLLGIMHVREGDDKLVMLVPRLTGR